MIKCVKTLLIVVLLSHSLALAAPKTHFAIYDPETGKDGVWTAEVKALSSVILKMGYSVQLIGDEDLEDKTYPFKVLIQPGGYATPRVKSIGPEGLGKVKAFVQKGGGYLGFCAGAYMATNAWDFAEHFSRQGNRYGDPEDYEESDMKTIAPLFVGWAVGPFGWHGWNGGTTPGDLERTNINRNLPSLKSLGLPVEMDLYYYGGPFFDFHETPENLEIWGRAVAPKGTPKYATEAHAQPTIVTFTEGAGHVMLSSYHNVFTLKGETREVISQNTNEWKLLRAMLQKALGVLK